MEASYCTGAPLNFIPAESFPFCPVEFCTHAPSSPKSYSVMDFRVPSIFVQRWARGKSGSCQLHYRCPILEWTLCDAMQCLLILGGFSSATTLAVAGKLSHDHERLRSNSMDCGKMFRSRPFSRIAISISLSQLPISEGRNFHRRRMQKATGKCPSARRFFAITTRTPVGGHTAFPFCVVMLRLYLSNRWRRGLIPSHEAIRDTTKREQQCNGRLERANLLP